MAKLSQTKLKRFMEHSATMTQDEDYPIFKAGKDEGAREMMNSTLSFLETKYLHPSVAPDSEEGKAILKIAHDLAKYLREVAAQ